MTHLFIPNQINSYLEELAVQYPDLVTLQSIGLSYEGREMVVIKISTGGDGQRPAVLVDGGIHAREWIAPAMALYIINQLVENNTANSDLTDAVDWYILPVLNPDGYEYSRDSVRKIFPLLYIHTAKHAQLPYLILKLPNGYRGPFRQG
jgi:murein tripeptide amidase MpaA